jgi:hypothetical protein
VQIAASVATHLALREGISAIARGVLAVGTNFSSMEREPAEAPGLFAKEIEPVFAELGEHALRVPPLFVGAIHDRECKESSDQPFKPALVGASPTTVVSRGDTAGDSDAGYWNDGVLES